MTLSAEENLSREQVELTQLIDRLLAIIDRQGDQQAREKLEAIFMGNTQRAKEEVFPVLDVPEMYFLIHDAAKFLVSRSINKSPDWKRCKEKLKEFYRQLDDVVTSLEDEEISDLLDNFYSCQNDRLGYLSARRCREFIPVMHHDMLLLLSEAEVRQGPKEAKALKLIVSKIADLYVEVTSLPFTLTRQKQETSVQKWVWEVIQLVHAQAARLGVANEYSQAEVNSACEAVRAQKNKKINAQSFL